MEQKPTSTNLAAKAVKRKKSLKNIFSLRTLLFAIAFFSACYMNAQAVLISGSGGTTNIPCGQNTFFQDPEGPNGYNNNEDGYMVFYVGPYSAVSIVGTYTTESGYDFIRIYSGVGTGGTQLLQVSGTGSINLAGVVGQTVTVWWHSDVSVTYAGFDLNAIYSGPCSTVACSGAPAVNTVVPAFTTAICPNSSMDLSFANSYNSSGGFYGYTYTWQSSTVSPVGPWTPISTGTAAVYTATDTSHPTTYYSAVVTCTAGGGGTVQTLSAPVNVEGIIVSNVPYHESFEGVPYNGKLPNCSWALSNTSAISTYTTAYPGYMFGQNSSRYLSFDGSNTAVKYAYTNGIQLYPGVTYSAAAWYLTEYSGLTNFTDFSLMLGTAQSSTGLVSLASTNGAAVASQYSLLSNTFVVTTPGVYYLTMRVTNTSAADHLSVDNISITAPCSLNSPTLAVSGLTTVCLGNPVNLTVSGADTYSWSNNGSNNSTISYPTTQAGVINFAVAGTNSLSGCITTVVKPVNVLAGPIVSAFMNDPNNSVCPGQTAVLYAVGSAVGYTWSTTGLAGANTTVAPTSPTTYTVLGSNATNCITSATIGVSLYTAPNVGGTASKQAICAGESVVLTATDPSLTYKWISNAATLVGSPVTAYPTQPTNYQLVGTDANGCTGTAQISVNVSACTGISSIAANNSNINVYPNPNNGEFTVELNNNTVKSIEVMDVTGRVLISNADPKGTVSFNIAHLSNGIYYVRVQSSEKVDVIKVVKQ